MKHFRFAVAAAVFSSVFLAPSTLFAANIPAPVNFVRMWSDPLSVGFPALYQNQWGLYIGNEADGGYARVVRSGDYVNFRSFPGTSAVTNLFGGGGNMTTYALTESAPQVWTFNGDTWTQITPTVPGFSNNSGAYGGAFYRRSLFIGTGNSSGAQVWRLDGAAWTQASIPGFSSNNIYVPIMTVYNNALYMGTTNYAGGAEIWKLDSTTWSKLSIPGFSQNNYAITSMAIYNNALHIGTSNAATGAELWKFNSATWSRVSIPGLAIGSITSLAEYPGSGALYIGTTNYLGGASQLWRFDGTSGTQVNIPGFSANNAGIVSMETYYNSFYFGTFNMSGSGAEIWDLPQMQPCAATLDSNLSLHIPVVNFNNQTYRANFNYDPNTQSIIFMNARIVADTSPFSSCTPATLSPNLTLHLPVVMYQGLSFSADFRNSTGLNFTATGVGLN